MQNTDTIKLAGEQHTHTHVRVLCTIAHVYIVRTLFERARSVRLAIRNAHGTGIRQCLHTPSAEISLHAITTLLWAITDEACCCQRYFNTIIYSIDRSIKRTARVHALAAVRDYRSNCICVFRRFAVWCCGPHTRVGFYGRSSAHNGLHATQVSGESDIISVCVCSAGACVSSTRTIVRPGSCRPIGLLMHFGVA